MKTYVSVFYARLPRKNDIPLLVQELMAESAYGAQVAACKEAKKQGIKHTYVKTEEKKQ